MRFPLPNSVLLLAVLALPSSARAETEIAFEQTKDSVVIRASGKPVATYVFSDPKISRPYFAHVHVPSGQQVTRHHPPRAGDAPDHATFHPGIWLAFGDLSGEDYWRLKAEVRHVAFVAPPRVRGGVGSFTVRNHYMSTDGSSPVCEEVCRYDVLARPSGYLLRWDSHFSSKQGFYFGDQEEMGLGVRVATPLSVVNGGRILDSAGRLNGKEVWGKQAKWCDYSGELAGTRLGMTLMPHPENFRQSWFHARDYGFVAANPFGVKAFTRGEASQVVVSPGEVLRLRFGIFLHSDSQRGGKDSQRGGKDSQRGGKDSQRGGKAETSDIEAAFEDYLRPAR